ncbi:hypothetical protein BTA35_0201855 [Oceanospirillum linum]|uniref:Aminotransferase class I/classII large domain-containing protein n=1 Tax=Oceanospirillum linum TaxID=966 RepID=A0A1T1HGC9_OCELI|nr:hypothetical protein BTA35_0201855 [Oceanospirillum linum]
MPSLDAPRHGGDLKRARQAYPDIKHWVDLSAGLNPDSWPVPAIPVSCFQDLPDDYDALLQAARGYYRQLDLWPVNGSQQGIELLSALFLRQISETQSIDIGPEAKRCSYTKTVAVPEEGYREHAWCWQKSGFEVLCYHASNALELIACAEACDILVVINPNNPTGQHFSRETLLACHRILAGKQGWLVVDEAFIDAYSSAEQERLSVACDACDSIIVLRSIGKFFGLAGIRSGFVLAGATLIEELKINTGPWPVSGVTSWLTTRMLNDVAWQSRAREQLADKSRRLAIHLEHAFPQNLELGQTPLFVSLVLLADASEYHGSVRWVQQKLAQQGIWVRTFEPYGRLRFGLPGDEHELNRLISSLKSMAPPRSVY